MSDESFINQADAILGANLEKFLELLKSTKLRDLPDELRDEAPAKELTLLAQNLHARGISNIQFDLTIQRGFDYYTGIVFEIFDTNPENSRSLFGGGRYDELLQIFKVARIPAVGFGLGDVTLVDFLRTHDLLPQIASSTRVMVVSLTAEQCDATDALAKQLRQAAINTATDTTDRKVGTKLKGADKIKIPYVIVVGESEVESATYTLKRLDSGDETTGDLSTIVAALGQNVVE